MGIHCITHVELAVPDLDAGRDFYREFGLDEVSPGELAPARGGRQLRLDRASKRGLVELGLGVDAGLDISRLQARLSALDAVSQRDGDTLRVVEPATGLRVWLTVAPRIPPLTTKPRDLSEQRGARRVDPRDRPTPGKLGHVVIASSDAPSTQRFFVEGLGFRVSDRLANGAAFLRCSRDHHNLLVQPGPRYFLHHMAWELPDVDTVGRAGMRMTNLNPDHHTWGLGRHLIGSNYFWYLRDPAGNFAEYYSDMDVIQDDDNWQAGDHRVRDSFMSWGPPPPMEFLFPPDVFPNTNEMQRGRASGAT